MWDTHSPESPADVTVKMAFVLEVGLTRDVSHYRAKLGGKSAAGRGWHPNGRIRLSVFHVRSRNIRSW